MVNQQDVFVLGAIHCLKSILKALEDTGESADEIGKLTLEDFKHLGIRELLTMQRQVGFGSLIERIIKLAND